MYIELVIADNFVLTYLAGACAARLCHKRVNALRTVAAAALGTVTAVFYPYLKCAAWLTVLIKLGLWVVLSVTMYVKTPRAILSSVLFLLCTFAFGGASYAIGLIIYQNSLMAEIFCQKYPLFLTLGAGAALYWIVRLIVKRLRLIRARAPYEYGTVIEIFGEKIAFDAFLDTGNCVFDERSGLPVIITDVKRFTDKLDGVSAVEFMKSVDKLRAQKINTAAGAGKIFIVKPKQITVYTDRQPHKIEAVVGLVQNECFSAEHEMLLNPAVFAEGV